MSRLALRGVALGYVAALIVLPVGMVFYRTFEKGVAAAWDAVTTPPAQHAFYLTVVIALIAVPLNAIFGVLTALLLARGRFPGKRLLDAAVDLPFAVSPVIVGLALILVWGRSGWFHTTGVIFAVPGMVLATIFVSLPFVVRSVQPMLLALDPEVEEAAASLGASAPAIFRRVILPSLRPAILAGVGLAFGRALGEFGAVVLISGNLPFKTELASVFVYGQLEQGSVIGAAAVSVVLMAASLCILLGISALAGREGRR